MLDAVLPVDEPASACGRVVDTEHGGTHPEPAPLDRVMVEAASARLAVRRPRLADLADVRAYRNHPSVIAKIGGDMSDRWIRTMLETQSTLVPGEDNVRLIRVIEHRKLGQVIGEVSIFLIPPRRHADLGWIIHPEFQRQGFATEAARIVVRAALDLGLHRLTAACLQDNGASWRVMERLGMRREGTFRKSRLTNEGWQDEFFYALLAEDEAGC